MVSLGDFTKPEALLAAIAFLIIAVLSERKVFGAVLIGILSVTLVGMMLGLVHYDGFFAAPPSLAPTFMAMDIAGALNVSMISVILAFLFVNMFDTAGTLMGVAERANLTNPETGKIEGLSKALKADSISSVAGACVGCPPVTSYVESAAGKCSRRTYRSFSNCGWCVVLSGNFPITASRHDPRLCYIWRSDLRSIRNDEQHAARRLERLH